MTQRRLRIKGYDLQLGSHATENVEEMLINVQLEEYLICYSSCDLTGQATAQLVTRLHIFFLKD
jgi:hypothetical protein